MRGDFVVGIDCLIPLCRTLADAFASENALTAPVDTIGSLLLMQEVDGRASRSMGSPHVRGHCMLHISPLVCFFNVCKYTSIASSTRSVNACPALRGDAELEYLDMWLAPIYCSHACARHTC